MGLVRTTGFITYIRIYSGTLRVKESLKNISYHPSTSTFSESSAFTQAPLILKGDGLDEGKPISRVKVERLKERAMRLVEV